MIWGLGDGGCSQAVGPAGVKSAHCVHLSITALPFIFIFFAGRRARAC